MFKLIDVVIGLRVKAGVEVEGLDLDEMGVPGYGGVTDNLAMPEISRSKSVGNAVPVEARS